MNTRAVGSKTLQAFFWVLSLLLSLFVVMPVLAQTVSVSKDQFNKDVWIANAKYNIDTSGHYEWVAMAAGLHNAFTADPQLTKKQGLSILHDTQTSFASWKAGPGSTANPN